MNRIGTLVGFMVLASVPMVGVVWALVNDEIEPEQQPRQWVPATLVEHQPLVRGSVDVEFEPGQQLVYDGAGGRVVSVHFEPGDQLVVAGPIVTVDQITVVGYASSAPLYRQLKLGDEGWDVAVLQDILRAVLGLDLDADGRVGSETAEAIRAYSERFVGEELRYFDPAWVIWYPHPGDSVGSVDIAVGDRLVAGDTIARTEPAPHLITIRGDGTEFSLPPSDRIDLIVEDKNFGSFARDDPQTVLRNELFMELATSRLIDGKATIDSVVFRSAEITTKVVVPGSAIRFSPEEACVVVQAGNQISRREVEVGDFGEFGSVAVAGVEPGEPVLVAPVAEVDRLCDLN